MSRQVVYMAHPQHTYSTEWKAECLQMLETLFPDADLIDPADLFESNEDWKRKGWTALLDVDAVVVFADSRGWIGLGVISEIVMATAMGKPVLYLHPRYCLLCTQARIREPHDRPFPRTPQATTRMFRRFARLQPDLSSALQLEREAGS